MKQYFVGLVVTFSLALFISTPVLAYQWPPEEYEMPRTVLTTETAGEALSGLRDSIRSIGNTGLAVLGACLSVFLIPVLFHRLIFENFSSHSRKGKTGRSALEGPIRRKTAGSIEMSGGTRGWAARQESYTSTSLEERLYRREHSYSSGELAAEPQRVRPHRRHRP